MAEVDRNLRTNDSVNGTRNPEAGEPANDSGTPGEEIEEKGERTQRPPDTTSSNGEKPGQEVQEKEKKPSKLAEISAKIGLDKGTVMMMFKGSVAPTIAIAFYQADYIAATYTTLGYLVAIISVISMPILPRAKFFQTLTLNLIGICLGCSIGLLGLWSAIQARKHTTPAGSEAVYNSSQAAVCAIWLFANTWFINLLRAKMPALQVPAIMYSILSNIAFTFGPLFQNMSAAIQLIRQLLICFLTAFALCAGVNLFVIPITSRFVVNKEQAGYIGLIRATLKAQTGYLQSLENTDMFAESPGPSGSEEGSAKTHPADTPQAKALKATITGLTGLHGKLHGDMPFAKREIAWGKLDAKDLDEIFTLFRAILIPLIGMTTIADIFERIAERRGWVKPRKPRVRDMTESWEKCSENQKAEEKRVWNEVMKALHEPFSTIVKTMDQGLEHAGLLLEILPPPKKSKVADEESKGTIDPVPGDPEFASRMIDSLDVFYKNRGNVLKTWAREKGLSDIQFDSANAYHPKDHTYTPNEAQHRRDQQQLYLILYLENLLYSAATAIVDLVKFADKTVADGTMKKNRLILPGQRRMKKWILSIGKEDTSEDIASPDSMESGGNNVYMGSGFGPKKDPEHLPPKTAWQHFGNGIRTIPRLLSSTESAFGLRVACATLSIGIIAFLRDSYEFFIAQRLVWAMIIIAIGMTMTSGQSIFGFFGRVAGTTMAMITSLVMWYIVDQKTPGIIVMLWLFIFFEMYFFLKFPRFIPIWLVAMVTQVLIIGYELQVRKIGLAAASASGQPYYPIYLLAPYRLAAVAAGSFVAFIWTIFPFPLSDRGWIRKDLGATLFMLANYYSVVHATNAARLHNTEGDMEQKSSPGRQLEKVRHKIFSKLMILLPSLQQHADWQKWEISIGGKFPRETYDEIAFRATNIMSYLSLISYATQTLAKTNKEGQSAWLKDLTSLIDSVGPTTNQTTSILCLLSASVSQGSALPPHLQLPEAYHLSKRLEALDKGILDSRHVEEPGYSAYAILQVASNLITDDLARLVDNVKELVGETDFSFAVTSSDDSFASTAPSLRDGPVIGTSQGSVDGKGKKD